MATHPSLTSTAGAVLLLLWAAVMWAAVGALALKPAPRSWSFRLAAGVIILGIAGQLGHLQEHVAQVGYWVAHPNEPPWMTPWGNSLAAGLGHGEPSKPALGMEVLHLTGNLIFLAGLVGVLLISRHAGHTTSHRWARLGVWMQGLHGVEHVALTLSIALGAERAIGLSTWFGLLEPGPGLWTYRIWWHFIANVAGSIVFAISVHRLWRERQGIDRATGSPLVSV